MEKLQPTLISIVIKSHSYMAGNSIKAGKRFLVARPLLPWCPPRHGLASSQRPRPHPRSLHTSGEPGH